MRRARGLLSAWLCLLGTSPFCALGCTGGPPTGPASPPGAFDRDGDEPGASPMALTPRLERPPIPPPSFDDPQRLARLRRALPAVEQMVTDHVEREAIPALAAGIMLDGELVLAKGWGRATPNGAPVTAQTVFRLGSVTNIVTGMAILALVADGKLRLDDPAAKHLPELGALLYPTLDGGVITVRHLLTHTSGLSRERELPGLKEHPNESEVLAALDGFALQRSPGEATRHSNLGAGLLGLIVARASGMPMRAYVSRRLLEPLGIDDVAWDAGDVPLDRLAAARGPDGRELSTAAHERIGPLEGSEGLYGSVEALAKLVRPHLAAWPPRNDPDEGPVPRGSLRESHRLQAFRRLRARAGAPPRADAEGTGLLWQIRHSCDLGHHVWHHGDLDGHRSVVLLLPRHGLAVILLATANDDLSPLASDIASSLVRTAQLPTRRPQPSPALSHALEEVVRMYALGNVNEPTYQRLFASRFRQRRSLQDVRRMLSSSRTERGPCRLDRVVSSPTPHDTRVRLRCERGEAHLHVRLTAQEPHQISQLVDAQAPQEQNQISERCAP